MKEIICLSHSPWQARPNRTQQLLTRMSDARILFFEPAPPRGGTRPEQGRRIRSHITVYTLPAPLPQDRPRTFFQSRGLSRCAAMIRETMKAHRFRAPVLWCTAPDQVLLAEQLPCRGVLYDCHREWGEEYLDLESDLVTQADVSFAASPGLVNRLTPCSDNIALLPNGVNPLMFTRDDFSPPDQLARLAGKTVLGRVGSLTGQVDLDPLTAAAEINPDWVFLLMGPVTRQVNARLSRYPNILMTGPVNAVELPDYLSVCSLLFDLKREDRRGCDIIPARVYEYLATGKPIVLVVEPGSEEPFPDVIQTAYDVNGFLRRCRGALREADDSPLPGQRQAYAEQSSWAVRCAEVTRILEATGLF